MTPLSFGTPSPAPLNPDNSVLISARLAKLGLIRSCHFGVAAREAVELFGEFWELPRNVFPVQLRDHQPNFRYLFEEHSCFGFGVRKSGKEFDDVAQRSTFELAAFEPF